MGILMGALAPHPPIIIPEIGRERRQEVQSTISSLEELAREIKALDPELIISVSPHGPVFSDALSVLTQKELRGDFGDFGYPELAWQVETDLAFIHELQQRSLQQGIELITLTSVKLKKYNLQARLDHGVLVPLSFLLRAGIKCPLIPLNMGLLDYQDLYHFGGIIQETLVEMGKKGVVLASGDLSHRLKPGAPAGYNPRGKEFDKQVVESLQNYQVEKLLQLEPQLIEKAGECGLRPLLIMLGALQGLQVKAQLKSYEGPFGVGYAVAAFYPEEVK